jgi:hypothetical protein
VIGGLLFSTLLSLVFVPAMFLMMDDVGAFIWRYGKRMLTSGAEAPEPSAGKHGPPNIVRLPGGE